MPRGRPKKVKIEAEAVEVVKVENREAEELPNACFHCKRLGSFAQCKGDRNQYKFCSTECYNADHTE